MKYLPLFLLLLFGCTTMQAGLSVHNMEHDAPEVLLENYLFKFRGTIKTVQGVWFFEHTSGLLDREDGYGLTEIGHLWNISP